MRCFCQFSRRWQTRFNQSSNFAEQQKCLLQWQTKRQYRQPATKTLPRRRVSSHEPIVVREYEQFGKDARTRRPVAEDPFSTEAKFIKAKLDKLDKELDVMKQGPFGPQSEFFRALPADERDELLRAVENEELNIDTSADLFTEDDIERIAAELRDEDDANSLAVTLRIPPRDKAYVRRFNDALQRANEKPNEFREVLILWKWYLRCQQKVRGFSSFVSEDVWNFLWNSLQKVYPKTKHVVMLANDMADAGVVFSASQIIDRIDALHSIGDTSTAIRLWEEQKPQKTRDSSCAKTFLEIGVKLYAAVARPSKAQEIAFDGFDNDILDPKVFVSVIQAWSESHQPNAANRLWFCYLKLKQRCSDGAIPTALLGQITSTLLRNGRQDMALAVFKDMLVAQRQEQKDSMEVYTDMLRKFSDVEHTAVDEDQINRIGLKALLTFPRKLKNKFFFGAWIKWLIGDGKVDDAASVVELMHEHGVKPDARHLNGIVGAWFRDGTDVARSKGEALAWAMVQSRVRLVNDRRGEKDDARFPNQQHTITENPDPQAKRLPRFLKRDMPPATIETFSILLQQYTRKSDVKTAEYLTEVMTGPADMKPNSFILNHWLYLSLRASDLSAMWSRYLALRNEIDVDLETFAVLWDGSKKNLDRTNLSHSRDYPNPRQLFAEMTSWLQGLDVKKRAAVDTAFSRGLYEQIIRCFCLSSDLRGTFLALRELQRMEQISPHDDIARMILMQIARMVPGRARLVSRARRPAMKRRDANYRSALTELANVLDSITDDKEVDYINQGAEVATQVEDPESPQSQMIRLDALSTFLCVVMNRQMPAAGNLFNELVMAAKTMNIEPDEAILRKYVVEAEEMRGNLPSESITSTSTGKEED